MLTPSAFSVLYRGEPLEFQPITSDGWLKGYSYQCPKHLAVNPHTAHSWIDTESGTKHTLSFPNGRATIDGSLICQHRLPNGAVCGWHVVIENGEARDV